MHSINNRIQGTISLQIKPPPRTCNPASGITRDVAESSDFVGVAAAPVTKETSCRKPGKPAGRRLIEKFTSERAAPPEARRQWLSQRPTFPPPPSTHRRGAACIAAQATIDDFRLAEFYMLACFLIACVCISIEAIAVVTALYKACRFGDF